MDFKKLNAKNAELRDFLLSVLTLSLISSIFDFSLFFSFFLIFSASIGLKILAEKYAAKKLDLKANYSFRYNYFILSLVGAIISAGSFVFPIVGFSDISGGSDVKRLGKAFSNIASKEKAHISLIGLLSSALLVFLCIILMDFNPSFFQRFFEVNSLILLFSLLPFSRFSGSNILWWSRILWVACALFSLLLAFLAFFGVNLWISLIATAALLIIAFIFWEKTF
ncbi:MAG: hypothetical protein PHT91_02010 [Candidatus Nanoarchaeia archaeon]|nr:hypothetical protein [Candidatus Nanoarchaeia archaeon]MDD5054263.1 hypothetical protein [Candidatus Nanoarchaeia archaeon]MDD5499628.1 hypothetical protein [Candidatus Nanoarchaeia archaeon]